MDTARRPLLAHDSVPAAGPGVGTAVGSVISTVSGHAASPGDQTNQRRLCRAGSAATFNARANDFSVSQRDAVGCW